MEHFLRLYVCLLAWLRDGPPFTFQISSRYLNSSGVKMGRQRELYAASCPACGWSLFLVYSDACGGLCRAEGAE